MALGVKTRLAEVRECVKKAYRSFQPGAVPKPPAAIALSGKNEVLVSNTLIPGQNRQKVREKTINIGNISRRPNSMATHISHLAGSLSVPKPAAVSP